MESGYISVDLESTARFVNLPNVNTLPTKIWTNIIRGDPSLPVWVFIHGFGEQSESYVPLMNMIRQGENGDTRNYSMISFQHVGSFRSDGPLLKTTADDQLECLMKISEMARVGEFDQQQISATNQTKRHGKKRAVSNADVRKDVNGQGSKRQAAAQNRQVVIVGYSFGGLIAAKMALRNLQADVPQNYRFALIAPVFQSTSAFARLPLFALGILQTVASMRNVVTVTKDTTHNNITDPDAQERELKDREKRLFASNFTVYNLLYAGKRFLRDVRRNGATKKSDDDRPILLLWGTNDTTVNRSIYTNDTLDCFNLIKKTIDGARHAPHEDPPFYQQVKRAFDEFIQTL